jgi:hypothetical protein
MSSPHRLRLAALAAILTLAGACSDSTGPSDVQPADLSQVLAELQPSSIAPLADQLSAVPLSSVGAPAPSSCSYDGASKSFICPNVSVTGITVSRSFTLLDASGAPQTAFDKTTTAAVRMKTTFAGTITSGGTTLAIDQRQDVTVSGLLTGKHTLNGTSLVHMTGSIAGPTAIPVATTISTTITDLVLPRSSSGSQWPQSGTIAATITDSSASGIPPTTTTVTIRFNGTSKATVAITVNGVTVTSTVDLANPGPVRG